VTAFGWREDARVNTYGNHRMSQISRGEIRPRSRRSESHQTVTVWYTFGRLPKPLLGLPNDPFEWPKRPHLPSVAQCLEVLSMRISYVLHYCGSNETWYRSFHDGVRLLATEKFGWPWYAPDIWRLIDPWCIWWQVTILSCPVLSWVRSTVAGLKSVLSLPVDDNVVYHALSAWLKLFRGMQYEQYDY
jgi:hypothetical protein